MSPVIPFVPLAALGTLVFTFVNTLRFLVARDWSAVVTQVVAWAAGGVGIFVVQATDFASAVRIGDLTLDQLGFWSTLLLGLVAASLLSTLNEIKKAVDRSDSARVPPLIPGATGQAWAGPTASDRDVAVPALPNQFRRLSC
jgi:hypothetical protein